MNTREGTSGCVGTNILNGNVIVGRRSGGERGVRQSILGRNVLAGRCDQGGGEEGRRSGGEGDEEDKSLGIKI